MEQENNVYTATEHTSSLNELLAALAKAQGQISHAKKDKKNPFFKSSYADLSSVWEACREPLASNGLSVIQTVEGSKTEMFLVTWLGHSSGQWIKSKLPMMLQKFDPQSQGSAITYARRYALSAMVGICAEEDDDGERAMSRKKTYDFEPPAPPISAVKPSIAPTEAIKPEQAREIENILDECDPKYKDQVLNFLETSKPSIKDLRQLPLETYKKIKMAALQKRAEYIASCEREMVSEEVA